MGRYLTATDVVEAASAYGLSKKRLRNWCEGGHVSPAEGGSGSGNHRKFTVLEAVGVAVASYLYTVSASGCSAFYVGEITAAFGLSSDSWLEAEFAAGRTHLMCVEDGRIELVPAKADWPDVREARQCVLAKVAEIEARPEKSKGGRKRGLSNQK